MKFNIYYGDRVLCLPGALLDLLDRADADTLKVLLCIAANNSASAQGIASSLGLDVPTVNQAIAFWRGSGLLDTASTKSKKDESTLEDNATPPSKAPTTVVDSAAALQARTAAPASLPRYTTEELSALLERRRELAELLNECANVFGKVFSTHEAGILLGIVDYLGVDGEYLLLLLAHCAKLGKKSVRYVEKFAFSLYDEGVTDLCTLQERLKQQEQLADAERKVRTLFGINSRALTTKERNMLNTWLFDMKYEQDVITRAYEITVDAIGKPSIPYTNSILERWSAAGLRDLTEIEAAEQARAAQGKTERSIGNSFDTDDFFGAALSRSFGEDFEPSMTKRSTASKTVKK